MLKLKKKIMMCDFVEYNSMTSRLGNYHYCNCFVKDGYEALWMSNAFNPLIYFKDKEDYRFKRSISTAERHQLADHIYGFAPYSRRLYGNYPFCKDSKILEQFEKYVRPNILESLHKMDFLKVDVLWISNPKAYWLTKVVNYHKLVYRIADDYSQFAEFPNITSIEELLIQKADCVVIVSSEFEERVVKQGKKPLLLSNGVMFEHFSQRGVVCPVEYQRSDRQKIVYVGALKYWFDTELVRKIAEQVEADVYLIGQSETDLSSLKECRNVHILGPRSYELLPGYMQYADVALIPFLKSSMTDPLRPLKLYEYCSAGVAVVSTHLTEIAKLKAPICVSENHASFISGVQYYLSQGYDRAKLREFASRNSWNDRYEQMKNEFLL